MTLGDRVTVLITTASGSRKFAATVTEMSGRDVYVTPHSGRYAGFEMRMGRGCEVAREVVK